MDNFAVKILLDQIKKSHEYFLGTLEGVDEKVAHFQPPGTANPIAGTWAHAVFTEDGATNTMFQSIPALFESGWKDRTGASSLQPTDWEHEYPKWLRSVKVDVEGFKKYTKAVFENTENYISGLTDDDLARGIQTSWEPTARPLYDMISMFIVSHTNNIMGEISVLKGIQGLKGYPF